VISVLYYSYTHLYLYVCLMYCMHGLWTCILHNSETLEPLTWIRVRPSHHYAHSLSLSLSLSLSFSRTHVLYHVHWTSVNIRHSNRSLDLSFRIYLATYHTLGGLSNIMPFSSCIKSKKVFLNTLLEVSELWHLSNTTLFDGIEHNFQIFGS